MVGRGNYKGMRPGTFVRHVWDFSGGAKVAPPTDEDVVEGEANVAHTS